MSSVNPKRRASSPRRGSASSRPGPATAEPSERPGPAGVQWVEGDELGAAAWHAPAEDDDLAWVGEGSELPHEVDEVEPEPLEDEPEGDLEEAEEEEDEDEGEAEITERPAPRGRAAAPVEAPARAAPGSAPDAAEVDKPDSRPRSKTIARKQMLRERRRMIAQGTIPEILDYDRPVRRVECREDKRPCLYVSCRYHLYLDVNPETGSIKLNFPDKEVWELEETCALDVAERGGITLEEVGEIMNLTRERIRQVEVSGLDKLKRGDAKLHTFIDGRELDPTGDRTPARLPIVD